MWHDDTLQRCPHCEGHVSLRREHREIGTLIECPHCGAELVVSNDEPPELDPALFEYGPEEGDHTP